MVWRFYSLRVSKDNLVSSIKNEDDDYEDNSSNVAEHHAIQRNVEDLNVNPPKKTKIEQWKSKKNVKVSKDLEQIEIIKELHEEIKAKNKRKRNNLPTQHQSPVLSPASQDPTLQSTPFTINHDKTSSNHEYNFQQEY